MIRTSARSAVGVLAAVLAPVLAPVLAVAAAAEPVAQDQAPPPVEPGEYHDRSSFEAFHGLRLHADGTYEWLLSVGAMDRRSSGTWAAQNGAAILTTLPVPVAPEFRRDPDDTATGAPFLLVTWPNGRGIAGIDLTLSCADGQRIDDYTQTDGWSLAPGQCPDPVSIDLAEPIHDVGPAGFDIRGSKGGLRFTLVPNDFGMADLTGTQVRPHGSGISFIVMGSVVEMQRFTPDQP